MNSKYNKIFHIIEFKVFSLNRALFGIKAKVDFISTNLPAEIVQKLSNEEKLQHILQENVENNVNFLSKKKYSVFTIQLLH